MRVYKVIQSGGSGGDIVLPALAIVPLIIGVLTANMIVTVLLPPLLIASGLYIKRVFYAGKPEWGIMLYRQLFIPKGSYTHADKDI